MIARRCCCGHARVVHSHDRPGSDCSQCTCDRWFWRWTHPVRWLGWRTYLRLVETATADPAELAEELGIHQLDQAELDVALREARGKGDG